MPSGHRQALLLTQDSQVASVLALTSKYWGTCHKSFTNKIILFSRNILCALTFQNYLITFLTAKQKRKMLNTHHNLKIISRILKYCYKLFRPATPGFGLGGTSQPSTGLFGAPATSAPAFGTTGFGTANTPAFGSGISLLLAHCDLKVWLLFKLRMFSRTVRLTLLIQ